LKISISIKGKLKKILLVKYTLYIKKNKIEKEKKISGKKI
jgi:hypothetical protein